MKLSNTLLIISLSVLMVACKGSGSSNKSYSSNSSSSSSSSSSTSSSSNSSSSGLSQDTLQAPSLSITFPINGSNLGGESEHIFIRGHITEQGTRVNNTPTDVKVYVNEVEAEFISTSPGEWGITMPINNGSNNFKLELKKLNSVESSTSLQIDNHFISDKISSLPSSNNSIYSMSHGRRAVIETNTANNQTGVLTSISKLSELFDCFAFTEILLNNASNKLAIECQNSNLVRSILIYDITNKGMQIASVNSPPLSNSKWLGEHFIISYESTDRYSVLDTRTKESNTVNVTTDNPEILIDDNDGFIISTDGYQVYINTGYNDEIIYFNLQPLDNGDIPSSGINALRSSATAPPLSRYHSAFNGGYHYHATDFGIEKINLNTGESSLLAITSNNPELLFWSGTEQTTPQIVHNNDTQLSLRHPYSGDLYKLDLATNVLTIIGEPSQAIMSYYTDIALKPNNTELAIYDLLNHKFATIDLSTHTLNQLYDFSDITQTIPNTFGRIDYDWENQIIYHQNIISWGGVEPSEEAHIASIDTQAHSLNSLVTGFDLNTLIPGTGDYRMGSVIVTNDPNIIWFSVMFYDQDPETSDDLDKASVYSYNVVTKTATLLYAIDGKEDKTGGNEPYLSSYSSELESASLTAWQDGYLRILNSEGIVEEITAPLNPYIITHNSEIDAANSRIFMTAYSPLDTNADYIRHDSKTLELVEVDMATGSKRTVASHNKGNGLPLISFPPFKYNEVQDLILDYQYGHIFIIDPYSGDRVIKAISKQ